jgi:hypothetical protein
MGSAFIVIAVVATQQVPEVAFAENDHMVEETRVVSTR